MRVGCTDGKDLRKKHKKPQISITKYTFLFCCLLWWMQVINLLLAEPINSAAALGYFFIKPSVWEKKLNNIFIECKSYFVTVIRSRCCFDCQLLDSAKAAHRINQRIREIILLHDNARTHKAAITRDKQDQIHWENLEHLPYTHNLSPCDFHLSGPLNDTALGRQRFQSST